MVLLVVSGLGLGICVSLFSFFFSLLLLSLAVGRCDLVRSDLWLFFRLLSLRDSFGWR